MNDISEKLKIILKIKNMSQKDLSDSTGITQSAISYYVSGKRTPDIYNLYRICKATNVSSDWILGLSHK